MRFAVISDVQANLPALQAVLGALESEQRIERVICAGDLVGLGPHPNEVLDLLRERDVESVMGNYDDAIVLDRIGSGADFPTMEEEDADRAAMGWTRGALTPENLQYLQNLPSDLHLEHGAQMRIRKNALDEKSAEYRRSFMTRAMFGGLVSRGPVSGLKRVRVVHGSMRAKNELVRGDTADSILKNIAENTQSDVVISGHARESFRRDLPATTFVGVGPVDSTFVGLDAAQYAVLDIGKTVEIEFRRVRYDAEAYKRDLERAGMPRRRETVRQVF
jgi:predicted phosphodiesterase